MRYICIICQGDVVGKGYVCDLCRTHKKIIEGKMEEKKLDKEILKRDIHELSVDIQTLQQELNFYNSKIRYSAIMRKRDEETEERKEEKGKKPPEPKQMDSPSEEVEG